MLYAGEILKLWYGEDLFNGHELNNAGTSCADIYVIMSINLTISSNSEVKIGSNVCFGSKDDSFGAF